MVRFPPLKAVSSAKTAWADQDLPCFKVPLQRPATDVDHRQLRSLVAVLQKEHTDSHQQRLPSVSTPDAFFFAVGKH
jgi:hypothetical protein